MKNLVQKWQHYRISTRKDFKTEKEYGRDDQLKRKIIMDALIFWKFIFREEVLNDDFPNTWTERQVLLSDFISNINPLIRVIAMVESLPSMVWRKILWKHNIDFVSFESFLRRLSADQLTAITENYEDLYVKHVIPRAFGKWDCFWKKLSVEKIFSEEYDYESRYSNKGAMSYNLLGLDFGFNAYPNSVSDDTRIVEFSPLRFLSKKNHANDFVVNQEPDGKYWWLYKKARSNYVWFPNRTVELNTHICPGFWYTMFIHLLFWVISPAMFISIASIIACNSFHETSWLVIGILGIPGAVTPLWLFGALLKLIITSRGVKWLDDFPEEHEKIWVGMLGLVFFIVASIVLFFVVMILIGIYAALHVMFGFDPAWSILIMIEVAIYIGYKIYFMQIHYNRLPEFKEYPMPFIMMFLFFIEALFIKYPEAIENLLIVIARAIINSCIYLWDVLVMMGPMSILLALYLIFSGLIWYVAMLDEERQEKFFAYLERITLYLSGVAWIAVFLLFSVSFKAILNFHGEMFYFFAFAFLSAIVFSCQKVIIFSLKPAVKESKSIINYANNEYMRNNERISYKLILRNAWLRNLNKQDRIKAIDSAVHIIRDIFCVEWRFEAVEVLIPVMTQKILDTLKENRESLIVYCYDDPKYEFNIFRKISVGCSFDEAVAFAKKEKIKKERRAHQWEVTKTVLKIMFFPIVLLWLILVFIFRLISKIREITTTFYRLYRLFNERCPYVMQKECLRMD